MKTRHLLTIAALAVLAAGSVGAKTIQPGKSARAVQLSDSSCGAGGCCPGEAKPKPSPSPTPAPQPTT